MALRVTNVGNNKSDSLHTSILIDKSLRQKDSSGNLVNMGIFAYENNKGSGNWVSFTPSSGHPGYAHFNYLGNSKDSLAVNTFTRGTWIPMIRPYFGNRVYTPINDNKLVNEDILEQNVPNPASDYTFIRFNLKSPGLARLSVSDIQGNEIAVLANKNFDAGEHEVLFKTNELSSGIYVIKLIINGDILTNKMVVIR